MQVAEQELRQWIPDHQPSDATKQAPEFFNDVAKASPCLPPWRYSVVWQHTAVIEGLCGSKMRQTFDVEQFGQPGFPRAQNIVSVTRWKARETDVPEIILSRGKHHKNGVWYYQVKWQGTAITTWQTKVDLGVYDYMAIQFDDWCRMKGC